MQRHFLLRAVFRIAFGDKCVRAPSTRLFKYCLIGNIHSYENAEQYNWRCISFRRQRQISPSDYLEMAGLINGKWVPNTHYVLYCHLIGNGLDYGLKRWGW